MIQNKILIKFRALSTDLSHLHFFLMLWNGALIAHLDQRHYTGLKILLGVFCFLGLFLSRSQILFLATSILQLVIFWREMPYVDNHWFFVSFLNLTMLGFYLAGKFKNRNSGLGSLRNSFPTLRGLVLLLYVLAAFHKLNSAFLDPEVSCAVVHVRDAIWGDILWFRNLIQNSELIRYGLIWGTLLLELSIPALLVSSKYRWLGILLGVTFHLATRMRHFPSIMFSLYFLFIGESEFQKLRSFYEKKLKNRINLENLFRVYVVFFSIWTAIAWTQAKDPWFLLNIRNQIAIWAVLILFFAIPFSLHLRKIEVEKVRIGFGVIALVFVLNAMSPYIGLKTGSSLAMWSNLNPTNERGNHLLMPNESIKVFEHVDDLLELKGTNLRGLHRNYVGTNKLISLTKLRRVTRRTQMPPKTPMKMLFEIDGEIFSTEDAKNSILAEPEPYWREKIVFVRDFTKSGKELCEW